jgi:hypothetical protein
VDKSLQFFAVASLHLLNFFALLATFRPALTARTAADSEFDPIVSTSRPACSNTFIMGS